MWLYDGEPDTLELHVRDAQPDEGGYVVLLVLQGGGVRLLGTRFPAKYVANWRSNAVRHAGPTLARVIVFGLHPRYEKIKRMLATSMAVRDAKDAAEEGDSANPAKAPSIESISSKAEYLFSISPATNAHLAQASQQLAQQA
ncbi:hypothetical protein [Paracidovorax citrulli]|uniref:hypothetical protein n=1 Tax=Paracidovorax citrulli TaxID=80869 RepID=UPI003FA6BC43